MGQDGPDPILPLTAQIVSAYVGRHEVQPDTLPDLIRIVYGGLKDAGNAITEPTRQPAVPIDESITDTHIICLEDGKSFQSLKRHLRVAFNLTPKDYRARWGLPDDYPMVAPAYARRRSALAKKAGLGRKP